MIKHFLFFLPLLFLLLLKPIPTLAQTGTINYCQDSQVTHPTPYISCLSQPKPKKCHYDERKIGENCIVQFTPESPYCAEATEAEVIQAKCFNRPSITQAQFDADRAKCGTNGTCISEVGSCLYSNSNSQPHESVYYFSNDQSLSNYRACVDKALKKLQAPQQAQGSNNNGQEIATFCGVRLDRGNIPTTDCTTYLQSCRRAYSIDECKRSWNLLQQQNISQYETDKNQYAQKKCGNNLDCQIEVKICYDTHYQDAAALANCTLKHLPVITDDIAANISEVCKGKDRCINSFRTCLENAVPQGQVIDPFIYTFCETEAKKKINPTITPLIPCQDNEVIHHPTVRCAEKKKCHFDTPKEGVFCAVQFTPENPASCVDANEKELTDSCEVTPAPPISTTTASPSPRAADTQVSLTSTTVEETKGRCNGDTTCLNDIQACLDQHTVFDKNKNAYLFTPSAGSDLFPCINKALGESQNKNKNSTPIPSAPSQISSPAPSRTNVDRDATGIPRGGKINQRGSIYFTDIEHVYNLDPNFCAGNYLARGDLTNTYCYRVISRSNFKGEAGCDSVFSPDHQVDKSLCTPPSAGSSSKTVDQSLYINELSGNLIKCRDVKGCIDTMKECYQRNYQEDKDWRSELSQCVNDALIQVKKATELACGIQPKYPYNTFNRCTRFIEECLTNTGDSFSNCVQEWRERDEQDRNTAYNDRKYTYVTSVCGANLSCRDNVALCFDTYHTSADDLVDCSTKYMPRLLEDSLKDIESECENNTSCINSATECLNKKQSAIIDYNQYKDCLDKAKRSPEAAGAPQASPQVSPAPPATPVEPVQPSSDAGGKFTITVHKLIGVINQSVAPAIDQLITINTLNKAFATSSNLSPAVFSNLPEGDYLITASNPNSSLYDVKYYVCNDPDCNSSSYSTTPPVVTITNSDRVINVVYTLKVPEDINRHLESCVNNQICRVRVEQCLADYNSNNINQAGLIECALSARPQDLSAIEDDIASNCTSRDNNCSNRIRQCINEHSDPYLNVKDYLKCIGLATIPVAPPAEGTQTTASPSPSIASPARPGIPTTQGSTVKAAVFLELSINGETDKESLRFTAGQTVNLGARLFNNIYKPNDGCPSVAQPVGLTLEFNNTKKIIPIPIYPCTPVSFELPDEPGEYRLSGYFPGEGALVNALSDLDFIIIDQPSIETHILAHINGLRSFQTSINSNYINIGGRLYVDSPDNCLISKIHLKLTKVADERGNSQDRVVEEGNFDNCTSYPVSLENEGAGRYILEASYSSEDQYLGSEDRATLTVLNIPTEATVTEIKEATISNKLLSFKVVTSPRRTFNPNLISTVHVVVNQVNISGSSSIIFNQQVINNNQVSIDITGLNNTDRFEITANYLPDDGSPFEPSSAEKIIQNQTDNGRVRADPFVKLTTDPTNPSSLDNSTVIATTNQLVQNPQFRLTKDNQSININQSDITSINSCQDGVGSCQYSFPLYELNGSYKISFCARDGLCDEIEFSTQSTSSNVLEIQSINLSLNGQNVNVPADGDSLNLFLGADNQISSYSLHFQVSYNNGQTVNIPLRINYSSPQTSQPPDNQGSDGTSDGNQPGGECDDVNYWDESVESCIHKWSESSYPNCDYIFDPVDNALCS